MCGICGVIGPGAAWDHVETTIRTMMARLAHRGPDGEGFSQGKGYALGHRRLSILDLEMGAQPMRSNDGKLTIVFNGEIYNYLELRQELIRRGERFSTFSDTEVLLKAYQVWGPSCVSKFNGMFAFCIHDERTGSSFVARDHFGIKPFYYSQLSDGSVVFASEIKALFDHPELSPCLNKEALNEYLSFQLVLGTETLFDGVHKLEPGHTMHITAAGDLRVEKYWDLDYSIDTHHTDEYFTDKLHRLLQDSIRWQLRSDVPVGAYLSGGVDSSSVVMLAAEAYDGDLKTFTGRFAEGEVYDESFYAKAVAQESGSLYFETVPTAEQFIDKLPSLIYHMDEPAAGPGLFPQYQVSQLAKKHVKVVLGGQGGDEVFGGYARYLVAYLEQCIKGGIYQTQEEGRHIVTLESIIPNLPLLKQYVPLLRSFWKEDVFEPMDRRYFRLVNRSHDLERLVHKDVWASYDQDAVFAKFQGIFNNPDTKSYFNKMTYFDQKTLLPALLQVEDRVSMAVSLESRVPLLDHRIADLAASIPPPVKFMGGQTKYSLKKAMGSLLPDAVLNRQDKMGFPVPLKEWWAGPLREFVGDVLLGQRSRERGLFKQKELESLIKEEGKYGRQLWGALCLELWHRAFIDGEML